MILPTRRALAVGAALSVIGVLGFRAPRALDAMLVADLALVLGIWLDASRAVRPGSRG